MHVCYSEHIVPLMACLLTHAALACMQCQVRQQLTVSLSQCRFIRDRLHERSPFFKLWPPHLQKLLCYIAHTEQFVKNEVIISRGSKPTHLYFLLEGEVMPQQQSAVMQCSTISSSWDVVPPLSMTTQCASHGSHTLMHRILFIHTTICAA